MVSFSSTATVGVVLVLDGFSDPAPHLGLESTGFNRFEFGM